MNHENLPVIIVGTGGASKETYYLIKKINLFAKESFLIVGFMEKDSCRIGDVVFDDQIIICSDETLGAFVLNYDRIGMVIPLSDPKSKQRIYQVSQSYQNIIYPNIVHPSVIIEGETQMGIGNIISAGSVLACDLKIGDFNLINRCCTTGHDVIIGDFNTLNPSAVISGNVTIGSKCMIGAGAVVLQGLTVEDESVLGAGAVLANNASQGSTLVGIPAKRIEK